jgi:hypothetical protein
MFIHGIIGRHEKMFWPQSRLSTRSSADTKKNVLTAIAFIDTIISRYEKNVLTAIGLSTRSSADKIENEYFRLSRVF